MPRTFDEWMRHNAKVPPERMTFAQYGNYAMGWRNSMPWAYKNMSVAYDWWAESRWDEYPDPVRLEAAWRLALWLNAAAVFDDFAAWAKEASIEEVADYCLSFVETIACLLLAGLESQPLADMDTAKDLGKFLVDRIPRALKIDNPLYKELVEHAGRGAIAPM